MKSAAQVGVLTVVAFVLFGAGVYVVGGSLFAQKKDVYTVLMPDAGGLAKGARVLMAGVQVGEVTEVGLDGPQLAKLKIGLKQGTQVPHSMRALISGSLVGLGDTPINLVQDLKSVGQLGDFAPGDTIPGGKAGPLDSILPDGGTELYSQLNETLKAVRVLLQNNGLQKDVRNVLATTQETMKASQDTLRAFTKIALRGDEIVAQNQAQIAAIVKTAERTLLSVQGTAEAIEKYAKAGHLQKGTDTLMADAHDLAEQSKLLLADIRRTVNDPALNANLRTSADNLTKTTEKLPGLIDNANKVAANVADLTASSKELPGKLGTILDKASGLEDRLGGLVDKFGGVLGKKSKGLPPFSTELDLMRQSDPGYWRTDLNLSFPMTDGFVTAGLWDAFGRNRINFQKANNLNSSLDYRYGIYAGRPSVGVDYSFAPRLGFRGDLWDFNEPQLDAKLRYELGGGLIGWLGVERFFSHPTFSVGVGIKQ